MGTIWLSPLLFLLWWRWWRQHSRPHPRSNTDLAWGCVILFATSFTEPHIPLPNTIGLLSVIFLSVDIGDETTNQISQCRRVVRREKKTRQEEFYFFRRNFTNTHLPQTSPPPAWVNETCRPCVRIPVMLFQILDLWRIWFVIGTKVRTLEQPLSRGRFFWRQQPGLWRW